MEAIPTSFSKVNKEYHRFLTRRKEKIKNVKYLEKQLTVAEEKKIIFENQVKICYNNLIKNNKEYEKVGMIKILDEMNFFGFGADNLKMPYMVEELGIHFLRSFSKWKWYQSRIEINTTAEQ